MIDLIYLFTKKFKMVFLKLFKKHKNKYQLINSNLEIKENEKAILSKIARLIK